MLVRLRISPARIKLAASNFARWFIGVQGRESPIFGNFAPQKPKNRTNRPATGKYCLGCIILSYAGPKRHATDAPFVEYRAACRHRSACVDIRPFPNTDVLVAFYVSLDLFIAVLLAIVMFDLVSSVPSQEIGWEARVRNDLFCVEWGVEP